MDEIKALKSQPSAKKIDKYHYNLHDIIGQGSFGTVYLGTDTETNQLRAIKVLPAIALDKDPLLTSSILTEIKLLKSLSHPNIIHCYDVLLTPNNIYLVMDYCEGGDLQSFLSKHKRLDEQTALSILKQLLKGYQVLLGYGVLHRDLKSKNILLKDGVFKIADFGFAKHLQNFEKQVLQTLVGTPLYMSPQLLKKEPYSSKSDVWSLGVIYFELLFGRTPWVSGSERELIKQILKTREQDFFPHGILISELSKNFILGCLKEKEIERLSWAEVLSHGLFEDCFDYKGKKERLEGLGKKMGLRLGTIVSEKKMDLGKLFESIDSNGNGKIEIGEFARLMQKIDGVISREEVEFIFNRVDMNGSGYIDFEEFKFWLYCTEGGTLMKYLGNAGKEKKLRGSENMGVMGNIGLARQRSKSLIAGREDK